MNELVKRLIQRTGINEEQARQVAQFLRKNSQHVAAWLAELDAEEITQVSGERADGAARS